VRSIEKPLIESGTDCGIEGGMVMLFEGKVPGGTYL